MLKRLIIFCLSIAVLTAGSVWYYDYSNFTSQARPEDKGIEYVDRQLARSLRLPETTPDMLPGVDNAGDVYYDPSLGQNVDGTKSNIKWTNALGDLIQVPYVQANNIPIAPANGGATWFGNGSVTDGAPTHFHGHTPGDFYWLFDVQIGDIVTITDDQGNVRDYEIKRKVDIHDTGHDREGNYILDTTLQIEGETINLQTCYDDDWNVVLYGEPVG